MSDENDPNAANILPEDEAEAADDPKNLSIDSGKDDKPLLSPAETRKLRRSYKILWNSVAENFEDMECRDIDKPAFNSAMRRADKLFTKVDAPIEALLDAKVVKHLSKLTVTQAECITTSLERFIPGDYATKLFNFFHETIEVDIQDKTAAEIRDGIFPQHLIILGDNLQHRMTRPAYLHYMYGSIQRSQTITVVEKKPRNARKAGLDGPGVATQTLVDDGSGKVDIPETGASLTEILVQSTLQQLVTIWKNADRSPIAYFDFVIDPESFGRSVENMFHVSFLIKENKARMVLDEDNETSVPFIEPIKTKKADRDKPKSSASAAGENAVLENRFQAIVSLTMEDWEELKDVFKITKAMISHENLDIQAIMAKNAKKTKKNK